MHFVGYESNANALCGQVASSTSHYHYWYKRTFRGFTCFTSTLHIILRRAQTTKHTTKKNHSGDIQTSRVNAQWLRLQRDPEPLGPNIKHKTYTTDRFTKNADCDTLLNSPPLSALNATKNIMTSSSVIIAVVENIGGRFSGSLRRVTMMLLTRSPVNVMASFGRSEGFVARR